MFIPPGARQKKRIIVSVLLSPHLQRQNFSLICAGAIGCKVINCLETFGTGFSSTETAHPRSRKDGRHTGVCFTGQLYTMSQIRRGRTAGCSNFTLSGPMYNFRISEVVKFFLKRGQ